MSVCDPQGHINFHGLILMETFSRPEWSSLVVREVCVLIIGYTTSPGACLSSYRGCCAAFRRSGARSAAANGSVPCAREPGIKFVPGTLVLNPLNSKKRDCHKTAICEVIRITANVGDPMKRLRRKGNQQVVFLNDCGESLFAVAFR